jgi:hypothetical protein
VAKNDEVKITVDTAMPKPAEKKEDPKVKPAEKKQQNHRCCFEKI